MNFKLRLLKSSRYQLRSSLTETPGVSIQVRVPYEQLQYSTSAEGEPDNWIPVPIVTEEAPPQMSPLSTQKADPTLSTGIRRSLGFSLWSEIETGEYFTLPASQNKLKKISATHFEDRLNAVYAFGDIYLETQFLTIRKKL